MSHVILCTGSFVKLTELKELNIYKETEYWHGNRVLFMGIFKEEIELCILPHKDSNLDKWLLF